MSDYIRTCTDENHAHECPVIRKSNETIIAERDALKAELEHLETSLGNHILIKNDAIAEVNRMHEKYNALRSHADKMAERLRIYDSPMIEELKLLEEYRAFTSVSDMNVENTKGDGK